MRLIARIARSLQQEYPHIRYHLYSGNAEDVAVRLGQGLLDFGIFVEPADMSKYDLLRLPVTDTWGVLMRRDSPLALRETVRPEDLFNLPLICSSKTRENGPLCFRPLEPKTGVGLDIVWKKYQVFSKPAAKFLQRVQKTFLEDGITTFRIPF